MTSNTVCITLNQVQIGMVSAEAIYSSTGLKLIDKGASITQTHLFRLKLYQIFNLHVYTNDKFSLKSTESNSNTEINALESDSNFKLFKKKYIQTISEINVLMYSLIEGNDVKEQLCECCAALLSYLPNKNDLFMYLYNIESKTYKEATLVHSLNVGMICSILGNWLKFSDLQIKELMLSGLLHDIGKFNISNEIINKPGRLTSEEFEIIKTHPISGYHNIQNADIAYGAKMAILQHHEKQDGSGYPYGFKAAQIHDYAKIVAIVDIYDAMTSERTYRKRLSPFCVLRLLEEEGHSILDTKYISVFLENLALLHTGKTALLSNGESGKIIFINRNLPSRPLVQAGNNMYNLEFETSLDIVDIL